MIKKLFNNIYLISIILTITNLLPTLINSNSNTNSTDTKGTDDEKIDTRIYYEVKNSLHFDNIDEYNEYIYRNDLTFLTYYYKKNDTNSKLGAYFLYKLENKLDFIAKILFIDCERVKQHKTIKECNQKTKEGTFIYPRFTLSMPPKEKYSEYTKKVNPNLDIKFTYNTVSSEIFYDWITTNLRNHVLNITPKNIRSFIKSPLKNKILIFTNKEDTTLLMKGLSNIFYDRILIGEVKNNEKNKEIIDEYKVYKYPTIISIQNSFFKLDKPQIEEMQDKKSAENIYNFIEKYSLKEKLYFRRLFEQTLEEIKAFKLLPHTYNVFFDKFEDKKKIIFFTETNSITYEQDKFMNMTNGFFVFGKINCKETKSICKDYFNVTEYPSVRYYPDNHDTYNSMQNSVALSHDFNKFENEISDLFKGDYTEVKAKEIPNRIFSARNENKYNFIYFYKDKLPQSVKLISEQNEYKSKIDFITIKNPSSKLMKAFKITQLPSASVIYHNKIAEEGFKSQKVYNPNLLEMRKLIEQVSIYYYIYIFIYLYIVCIR